MPIGNTQEERSAASWETSLAAFMLGLTSLVTQVIVLRECLAVFYGNELVIGSLLATWMVLTGFGAFLGFRVENAASGRGSLVAILLLVAILPFLTVMVLRIGRNLVFAVGTMIDPVSMLWSSLILLLPYCVLSGMAFTLLASSVSRSRQSNMISSIYAIEATGSAAGGILYSLFLIHLLSTFQVLTMLLAVNLLSALAVARDRRKLRLVIWVGGSLVLIPALLVDVDMLTRRLLFPGQTVIDSKDSPFGNLTVTRQGDRQNFFENNVLLASTDDLTGAEESVHFAMAQRPLPKAVLMVSGGATGAIAEVLKYDIERLEYVELNRDQIEMTRRYTSELSDERIRVVNVDPRLLPAAHGERYDVVLLNTPEPSSIQTNRFYTAGFFKSVKGMMQPDAVLSFGLLGSTDYQSEHARAINSTMMKTLRIFFKNVLLVPGYKTYFLASDGTLSIAIGQLMAERKIQTTYVNQYYLDDADLVRRSQLLSSSLDATAAVNEDFEPVSYYRHLQYWLSYFRSGYWMVALGAVVLVLLLGRRLNSVTAGVISGGFAASCIEIILLLAFQMLYGYVYQVLGLIVTIFMGGLACGAFVRKKLIPNVTRRLYGWIQIAIALYCAVLAGFLIIAGSLEIAAPVLHGAIFILTLGIAGLVGLEFSAAAVLSGGSVPRVASDLYSVDLIGSALGAFLVGSYLIPIFGVVGVSLLVGSFSMLTGLFSFMGPGSSGTSPRSV